MTCFKKSPQTESCTDSGAENEGSCHSDQMSNDFSNDDGIDEGICLENNSAAERISKVVSEKVPYIICVLKLLHIYIIRIIIMYCTK